MGIGEFRGKRSPNKLIVTIRGVVYTEHLIMEYNSKRIRRNIRERAILIIIGVMINVIVFTIVKRLDLPVFLDTIGSIGVAALGGMFPGALTAFLTNIICDFLSKGDMYFTFINVLIAIYTVHFLNDHDFQKPRDAMQFALISGVISGTLGTLVGLSIFESPLSLSVNVFIETLSNNLHTSFFVSYLIINILFNILDKTLSVFAVSFILRFIPEEKKKIINAGIWRQRPLTKDELIEIKEWEKDLKKSSRSRMILVLVSISLILCTVMGWISGSIYFENEKQDRLESAKNAVSFAASVIDPDKVNDYIKRGRNVEGYNETEEMLYKILKSASGVEYLYAVKIDERGVIFVFDMDSDDGTQGYEPGTFSLIEDAFYPYLPDLLQGKEIEPIENNSLGNWLMTVYYPLKDDEGNCVCYVGADISLDYMAAYTRNLLLRVVTILAGFLLVILVFGIWISDIYNAYPISSLAKCVDGFSQSGLDQKALDDNVRALRKLDIYTGDEVEKLYSSICDMTLNQAEQMRNLRRLNESTAKMQQGLIMTMANMVENRDSDTGAHIQKTAAYVKIIVEGLEKKGYYAEKITPKFMSDVVRSAPLHDVGKINIPDSVLNKPGKLTPEEFEIMKTHTVQGMKIIENAISTVSGENYLKEARNMAAYHHERWDGKGYPEGLHGEVIPLSARIMAVADVFDALTSPRVYKPAFPLEKALEIIKEGSGTQFDPKCIEVFFEAMPEVKAILRKYNKTE